MFCIIATFTIVNGILIGFVELVYPASFLFGFFVIYGPLIVSSIIQANAIEGLENLPEPRHGSFIHGAWLYVKYREEWAMQLTVISCILGLVLGAMTGFGVCLYIISQSASWTSVLLGIFLTFLVAAVLYFEYWTKQTEISVDNKQELLKKS